MSAYFFDQDVERRRLADEPFGPAQLDARAIRAARPQPCPAGDEDEGEDQAEEIAHTSMISNRAGSRGPGQGVLVQAWVRGLTIAAALDRIGSSSRA